MLNNDGFNERMNYIQNSNNVRNKSNNFDNSFAKMRTEERKNMVETTEINNEVVPEEARGERENFVIRNNAMNSVNHKPMQNNPVQRALQNNMFKR